MVVPASAGDMPAALPMRTIATTRRSERSARLENFMYSSPVAGRLLICRSHPLTVERLMFVAARHRARIGERGWTEGFTQKRAEGTSDDGYGQQLTFVFAYLTQPSGGSGQ